MELQGLPIVIIPVVTPNPNWVPKYRDDRTLENGDTYNLPEQMMEAEVLTLHLNTGRMRCRVIQPLMNRDGKKANSIFEVSTDYFFNSHSITKDK